jgi:hypothetical protein
LKPERADAYLLPPISPDNCLDAVLLAEFRYERQVQSRISDRIDALLMLALMRSPTRPTMHYTERHFLTAFIEGETIFSDEWRLR